MQRAPGCGLARPRNCAVLRFVLAEVGWLQLLPLRARFARPLLQLRLDVRPEVAELRIDTDGECLPAPKPRNAAQWRARAAPRASRVPTSWTPPPARCRRTEKMAHQLHHSFEARGPLVKTHLVGVLRAHMLRDRIDLAPLDFFHTPLERHEARFQSPLRLRVKVTRGRNGAMGRHLVRAAIPPSTRRRTARSKPCRSGVAPRTY